MSDLYWIGKAAAVAQVTEIQITAHDAATTYTLTIGGVTVSVPGTGGTAAATATALAGAANASTHPYFAAVTWTPVADKVIGTADVAGVPFVVASSKTGGTGTIAAASTTQASAGPNHWDTPGNWSTGAVPVSTDNVRIEDNVIDILWGLDQSSVTLASLRISQANIGKLGLPWDSFAISTSTSVSTVIEYRPSYLKISATVLDLGYYYGAGSPGGSPRIKIDTGANATTATVYNSSSQPVERNLKTVRLLGTHASNVLHVVGGLVAVAADAPYETAQYDTITIAAGSANVQVGAGVTLGDVAKQGGTLTIGCSCTSLVNGAGDTLTFGAAAYALIECRAGNVTHNASGGVTSLQALGGTVTYNSQGVIAAATVAGATLTFALDPRHKEVTALVFTRGSIIGNGDIEFTDAGAFDDFVGTLTLAPLS